MLQSGAFNILLKILKKQIIKGAIGLENTMPKVNKAIILNAGVGHRLRPLTIDTPKCLLTITNRTILESKLSNLSNCGINEIIMVVGFFSEKIMKTAKHGFPDLKFEFICNQKYATTNTLYSLWLAMQELDDAFVYLNGDVLFHRQILHRLLNSPRKTCLAVSAHKLTEEDVKVILHDDLVLAIGKHLQTFEADAEFIGIAKFSKGASKALKRKLNEVVKSGGASNYFEYALDLMLEKHNVYAMDISEFPCIEIDTMDDLEQAKSLRKDV